MWKIVKPCCLVALLLSAGLHLEAQILPSLYGVYSRVNTVSPSSTPPNIVTTNLALHFDAANGNSYAGTGTTWKDLAGTADATLYNGPAYSSNYGGMFTFDGSNDRASTSNITLSHGSGFTVEILVRFNSVAGGQGIVTFNDEAAGKYINFYKGPSAGMRWEVGAGQSITGTNNLTTGVWYHFTGVYDGTTAKLYRNGVLETSAARSTNTSTTTSYVMGAFNNIGQYPFNGNLAISRFYTRALTDAEVLQNYNATRVRFAEIVNNGLMMNLATAPPTGYSTWGDMSGNGNHATVTGTTSYQSGNSGGIITNGSSYINTAYNLGSNYTISMACSLNPSSFWATLWGNESYFAGRGYLAYFSSSTYLNVGSPTGTAGYSISGINTINIWDFTVSGTTLTIYKNGTSVFTGTITAPSGGLSTTGLYFGARHTNSGTSFTDACPGTYYSMRVYNRALSNTEISTNFSVLRGIYGL